MFENISVIGNEQGLTALYSRVRVGSAVSAEAQTVQLVAQNVMDSVERSQALFGNKSMAISQIWALANECAEPDWDGDGALAINHIAVFNAVAFIRALPDSVPMPECAPEPDGSISLDWIQSRNRLFSLSFGTTKRLAYAWLDGTDKGHAVARFDDAEGVPPTILAGIKAIINSRNAIFRSS